MRRQYPCKRIASYHPGISQPAVSTTANRFPFQFFSPTKGPQSNAQHENFTLRIGHSKVPCYCQTPISEANSAHTGGGAGVDPPGRALATQEQQQYSLTGVRSQMDVGYFLNQRVAFIRQFYDTAATEFRQTKRKIEDEEPPF